MAKTRIPNADGSTEPDDLIEIDLKNPILAGVLAWALPGLGHLYQGRTAKGILFFICILGTFIYGMYLGGGKVVYAAVPWEQQYRWQHWCQLGVGLPSTPMLIQKHRVMNQQEPLWDGFMAPPAKKPTKWIDYSNNESRQPNELAAWTVDHHPYFEIGTIFTMVAGLLNVLVICDAAGGPLIISQGEGNTAEEDTPEEGTS